MKHLLLLVLAAAIGALPSASAQEPKPETVDTSFAVPVKRPILFQVLAGDTSKPQAFYDSLAAEIRKKDKSARFEKMKSPIGAGFACLMTDRSQPEGPQRIRAEVYPYRSVFLLYKLVASPKSYTAAEREFIKARASLSEMK